MTSRFKTLIRNALRWYLTNTPIRLGRYPLMMAIHPLVVEPKTIKIRTKDRGTMLLDLQDSAQFPIYYNIYEWKDKPTIEALIQNARTVIDIGGNIGQMALLFARHAERVVTFEPIPSLADRLQQQIALNNLEGKVILKREALSDHTGELRIELPSPENQGTGSSILSDHSEGHTIVVKAESLDRILTEMNIADVDFLKMDIEGAELFALRGMTNLLTQTNNPILILEMNAKMMTAAGYGSKELLEFLLPFQYQCYEFVRGGLKGPLSKVEPVIENYCFLTARHLDQPNIRQLIV